jgi:alpha-galactosidase
MNEGELWVLAGRAMSMAVEPVLGGAALWRHFGARIEASGDKTGEDSAWPLAGARPPPPNALDGDPALSVATTHGLGWFAQPALLGSRADGSDWAQQFELADAQRSATHLQIRLHDTVASLALTLRYDIDAASDMLTCSAELENLGDTPFRLDWLAAACVPLPPEAEQVIGFAGRWTLEFQQSRERLGVASWRRESRRGRNSHDAFPGVIVGTTLADDDGAVWGAHLAWSGNHTLLIEPLTDGRRQLQLGEWFAPGEVVLAPGERYRTPDAHLTFSAAGLNGMSANFHRFVRSAVLRWPEGRMAPRPVHLNTWEAVYFNHDLEGLKALASAGAEVGVERFVLDDGWFHHRDNDRAALGDWWPDERKYPNGLTPLIDHVRALGLQFGLWVEPEMVNPASELYRAHPDWALQMAGRPIVLGRHQLVLDLARDEVAQYLFDKLDALLREHPIAYLKWDMNRDLATAALGADHRGRAAYRQHTLALYRLLARVREAHPGVEIESCSSGGARPDAGILRHTHRVWTSDCNDALTRIGIQSGFLRFLPPEIMGAHIGPAHSHTTGRTHSLAFRAAVALFGHLGLELDVRELDAAGRSELAAWIASYKAWRDVVHHAVIRQGAQGGLSWLQATASDAGAALFALYRRTEDIERYTPTLRVQGLDPARRYALHALHVPQVPHSQPRTALLESLAAGTLIVSGAQLRDIGLPLPPLPPEAAIVIGMKAVP